MVFHRLVPPVALGAVLAAGASGQAVEGRAVEAGSGRAITDARVFLVDTASVAVDSVRSDSAGQFRLQAHSPGPHLVNVEMEGFLSYSNLIRVGTRDTVVHRVEMPVVSVAAALVMQEVIDREAALQLPLEELCAEPLRPWEAGLLVGVARERDTLDPVPRAVARIEAVDPGVEDGPWIRVATATGTYWFCNLPPGRVRVVASAEGFRADTSYATIRAGTVSWFDSLLDGRR